MFFRTFCKLVQNEEFHAAFENFQNTAKLDVSAGGTIRRIIVAVRAHKSNKFKIF